MYTCVHTVYSMHTCCSMYAACKRAVHGLPTLLESICSLIREREGGGEGEREGEVYMLESTCAHSPANSAGMPLVKVHTLGGLFKIPRDVETHLTEALGGDYACAYVSVHVSVPEAVHLFVPFLPVFPSRIQ